MSVRVVQPIGETTYPDVEADMFELGVLTITSVSEPERIVATFGPDDWLEAICYDDRTGYPRYAHQNPSAAEARQKAIATARQITQWGEEYKAERLRRQAS